MKNCTGYLDTRIPGPDTRRIPGAGYRIPAGGYSINTCCWLLGCLLVLLLGYLLHVLPAGMILYQQDTTSTTPARYLDPCCWLVGYQYRIRIPDTASNTLILNL